MPGHRKCIGNEQLQTTYTGTLGAGVQLDLWAFCQSVFEHGSNYVKAWPYYYNIYIYIYYLTKKMSLKTMIHLDSYDGITKL